MPVLRFSGDSGNISDHGAYTIAEVFLQMK